MTLKFKVENFVRDTAFRSICGKSIRVNFKGSRRLENGAAYNYFNTNVCWIFKD